MQAIIERMFYTNARSPVKHNDPVTKSLHIASAGTPSGQVAADTAYSPPLGSFGYSVG